MITEQLNLLKEPIPVPEFEGVIAYKGEDTERYYFLKWERYMGIPILDMKNSITLMQRCDIAFQQGELIPEYLNEYLVGYD